jgi:hypothetical protein
MLQIKDCFLDYFIEKTEEKKIDSLETTVTGQHHLKDYHISSNLTFSRTEIKKLVKASAFIL